MGSEGMGGKGNGGNSSGGLLGMGERTKFKSPTPSLSSSSSQHRFTALLVCLLAEGRVERVLLV
jgi:hypothetical protein